MNTQRYFYFLSFIGSLLIVLVGCKPQQTLTPYKTDLAAYRPIFEVSQGQPQEDSQEEKQVSSEAKPLRYPNNSQEEMLKLQLEQLANENKKLSKTQGFRVQVYSGVSREKAVENQRKAQQILRNISNTNADIVAEMPNYRVRLGYFFTRIEAESILNKLRDEFPDAIIVKDEIEIRNILARYKN
ncbi:MAG: SPOR domain-containing protein [Bernardetiaceae bacterium]|nr:SPOR domain-containing protein [Bernardetiaceae bacterium]